MLHQCPNCRERIAYFRMLRTTAWGRFGCPGCGSVLGVSLGRRLLGAGVWLVGMVFFTEVLHLYTLSRWITYPGMAVGMIAALYLCERVILIERRAFTCRTCGYDLHGLAEPRCPECGAAFDPDERERILARAQTAPPRSRYWPVAILVVLGLSFTIALGIKAWRTSAGTAPPPAPTSTPATFPAESPASP